MHRTEITCWNILQKAHLHILYKGIKTFTYVHIAKYDFIAGEWHMIGNTVCEGCNKEGSTQMLKWARYIRAILAGTLQEINTVVYELGDVTRDIAFHLIDYFSLLEHYLSKFTVYSIFFFYKSEYFW